MATTVVIPARNEQGTIGPIVTEFIEGLCNCNVFVGIDYKSIDATGDVARAAGATVIRTTVCGKGQVVWQTLVAASMIGEISPRVVLCDADYTGLTAAHIYSIIERYHHGMTVGIPDWPDIDVPDHVIWAWPRVSGFRCVPISLIPPNAHGYLLETQMEVAAEKLRMPIHRTIMNGLKSPFEWPLSAERNEARIADGIWGRANGVLP